MASSVSCSCGCSFPALPLPLPITSKAGPRRSSPGQRIGAALLQWIKIGIWLLFCLGKDCPLFPHLRGNSLTSKMYVREQFAFAVVSFCDSVLFPADSFSSHPPVANYLISVQSIFGRAWMLLNISARGRRVAIFVFVVLVVVVVQWPSLLSSPCLDSIPRSSKL